jgi:hypothetical protein
MGRRGAKPRGKVARVWSPEMAYAVGLIATDGCLLGSGRTVAFTSKDRELVVTLLVCLKIDCPIYLKCNGSSKRKIYNYVQICDVLFYRWLVSIGITPRKSHTITNVAVPNRFFADFMRGCLDGDGSVWTYRDKRWRSSHLLVTAIASASRPFLEWMQKRAACLLHVRGDLQPSGRYFQLKYYKSATHALMQKLYYKLDVPHLRRKRERYLAICELDQ